MKRRRNVHPAVFLDGRVERAAGINGLDVVLLQNGRWYVRRLVM